MGAGEPSPDRAGTAAAVLFDFSGTLFGIESAHDAVVAALGPSYAHWAQALARLGAINGSPPPDGLGPELSRLWDERDLSAQAHRAAYSTMSRIAGLTEQQAAAVYARGIDAAAWHPYPDTVAVLRRLRDLARPVAVVSNIGWDPRPVLERWELTGLIDTLVLSYERGVQKPDPAIFELACTELGVEPGQALMVGDNREADGAAVGIGCSFAWVSPDPGLRAPDALTRAVFGGVPDAP